MVWIHGGGFGVGSGGLPLYMGDVLAKRGDVVVVTLNHRLNIFGYAHVGIGSDERFSASGNSGQLDLVAALRWVRDNIEFFGGDPGNVTLFGQSGGGYKINALLAMPSAKGLFHKAIVQSGSALAVMPLDQAIENGRKIYARLGFRVGDVDALQRLSAERLLGVFRDLTAGWRPGNPGSVELQTGPVVDGEIIPHQTWTPEAPTLAASIPMLIGTTRDESVAVIGRGLSIPIPDEAALLSRIVESGSGAIDADRAPELLRKYSADFPGLTPVQLLVRVTTDAWMGDRAARQADLKVRQRGAPVFLYRFDWEAPAFGGSWAPHGAELPFIFGRPHRPMNWDGTDVPDIQDARASALSAAIMACWSTFARTGNPSTTHTGRWEACAQGIRHGMVFGSEIRAGIL